MTAVDMNTTILIFDYYKMILRIIRNLSEYIQRAQSEISEPRPNDLKQDKIPRAGLQDAWGPALDGEGIQQGQVDNRLAADMVADTADDGPAEEIDAVPENEAELDVAAEPPNGAAQPNGSDNGADLEADAGQDDIDAMFD